MVGHVFTCMFGAQPRGIASLPAQTPLLRPFPVLWGETSLGGGQQQSDSGKTAGGVWGEEGGITHKSLGLAYPDLGQPESAGGGRSYPPAGCCLKYKDTAWPLQLDDKHIIEERKRRRRRMVMGRGRAGLLKYDHVFEIDRAHTSHLPCC